MKWVPHCAVTVSLEITLFLEEYLLIHTTGSKLTVWFYIILEHYWRWQWSLSCPVIHLFHSHYKWGGTSGTPQDGATTLPAANLRIGCAGEQASSVWGHRPWKACPTGHMVPWRSYHTAQRWVPGLFAILMINYLNCWHFVHVDKFGMY